MRRSKNQGITAKNIKKSINSICNTKEKPYQIGKIKSKIKDYYDNNISNISETILVKRLIDIETRAKYAPNVIMAVVWGLVTSFSWWAISESNVFSNLSKAYLEGLGEVINAAGKYSTIEIAMLSIVMVICVTVVLSVIGIIFMGAYETCHMWWCDKYSLFISEFEKNTILELLQDKYNDSKDTRHKVMPRKLSRIK